MCIYCCLVGGDCDVLFVVWVGGWRRPLTFFITLAAIPFAPIEQRYMLRNFSVRFVAMEDVKAPEDAETDAYLDKYLGYIAPPVSGNGKDKDKEKDGASHGANAAAIAAADPRMSVREKSDVESFQRGM